MATRKKQSRKGVRNSAKRRTKRLGVAGRNALGAARSAIARIEAELPASLRDYVGQVEGQLNRLEKRIEKAGASARKQATRLLREASKQVGSLEARGEAAWSRLTAPYRKEAVTLLDRLEAAIAPPATSPKPRRKRARKKKASR
jgi:hypothetical protein